MEKGKEKGHGGDIIMRQWVQVHKEAVCLLISTAGAKMALHSMIKRKNQCIYSIPCPRGYTVI